MRIHPVAATLLGPLIGLLGAGMWLAGWRRTGLAVTVAGLPGFVAAVAVLWWLSRHFWQSSPAWWVPAAVAAITYAIAVPAAWIAGIVAWDRNR